MRYTRVDLCVDILQSLDSSKFCYLYTDIIKSKGRDEHSGLILVIFDMNLYRARVAICGRLKSFIGFFKLVAMRDEWLQIDDFVLQQSDGFRPGVVIAVDELQIDLQTSLSVRDFLNNLQVEFTSANETCMNGTSFMMGFPTPMTMTSPAWREKAAASVAGAVDSFFAARAAAPQTAAEAAPGLVQ